MIMKFILIMRVIFSSSIGDNFSKQLSDLSTLSKVFHEHKQVVRTLIYDFAPSLKI